MWKEQLTVILFIVLFAWSFIYGGASNDGPAFHEGVTSRGQ
jgi:hypothetical protein